MLRLKVPWEVSLDCFCFVSIYILMADSWIPDTLGCDMNHMIPILRKHGQRPARRRRKYSYGTVQISDGDVVT